MNFARLFQEASHSYPHEIAVVEGSTNITYAQLRDLSDRFARSLQDHGIPNQGNVAMLCENSVRSIAALLGCMKANVIPCMVNTRLAPAEVQKVLANFRISLVVWDDAHADHVRGILQNAPDCQQVFVGADEVPEDLLAAGACGFTRFLADDDAPFALVDAEPQDTALRLFTSGTTGLPKAIAHSHAGLTTFIAQYAFAARHGCGHVEVAYGGSPIGHQAVCDITKRLSCALTQAYGSTEVAIVSTLTGVDHLVDPATGDLRAYSVGKPLIGVDIRILGDSDEPLPAGASGEIWVMSPGAMEAKRNAWVATGDMGHFDENGFLYIDGRKDDLIISGGENVYPAEIEECIRLIPEVADVAVVGEPHEKWGEAPVAFVMLKEGAVLSDQDIIGFCKEHIARYKRPQRVEFVSSFPVDSMGKVSRVQLRKLL